MNNNPPTLAEPLLYYRTREDIEAYARKPVEVKLAWLQAQMEFFFSSMTEQAKRAREQLLGNGRSGRDRQDPESALP